MLTQVTLAESSSGSRLTSTTFYFSSSACICLLPLIMQFVFNPFLESLTLWSSEFARLNLINSNSLRKCSIFQKGKKFSNSDMDTVEMVMVDQIWPSNVPNPHLPNPSQIGLISGILKHFNWWAEPNISQLKVYRPSGHVGHHVGHLVHLHIGHNVG